MPANPLLDALTVERMLAAADVLAHEAESAMRDATRLEATENVLSAESARKQESAFADAAALCRAIANAERAPAIKLLHVRGEWTVQWPPFFVKRRPTLAAALAALPVPTGEETP